MSPRVAPKPGSSLMLTALPFNSRSCTELRDLYLTLGGFRTLTINGFNCSRFLNAPSIDGHIVGWPSSGYSVAGLSMLLD